MIPIHPLAEIFPALDGVAFEALKADIAANGLSVPITLWRGSIIDGRNRYRALIADDWLDGSESAYDLLTRENDGGWAVDLTDDLTAEALPAYVVSLNLHRRHLTESQRAMVAARLATMGHGGARRGGVGTDQAANLPLETTPPSPRPADAGPPSPARGEGAEMTTAQAAKMLSVSERSTRDARSLFRGPVELIEDVSAGRVAVSAAANALREVMEHAPDQPAPPPPHPGAGGNPVGGGDVDAVYAQVKARLEAEKAAKLAAKKARREQRVDALGERLAASNESLAALGEARRYGVILADPEWRFETWSLSGKDRSAENHYPCSALDDIKARPVSAIAAEDCLLLLWATAPMLPQALEVMAAWGFGYRSHLIWCKDRIGTGYWARNQHELLLIGVKGDIPAPAPGTQPPSVLDAPLGPHSAKPPFAHEFAERCWPGLPRIELNARVAREGWDAWGVELAPPPAPPPSNLGADGDPGETPPHPAADDQEDVDGRHKADHDAEERGAAEDDAGHPIYGPDYNRHGVLRVPPAETLAMPQAQGAKHARAVIELHPDLDQDRWMWAVSWSGHEKGYRFAISPKWSRLSETRDGALKAAIGEIAERLGTATGITAAADKAIMTWLEGLAPQAGADAALPARAAAKGRLSRRKQAAPGDAGPADTPSPETQPEHQGEPA
jgi:N6-adenosine-specific RNA methylase IME4